MKKAVHPRVQKTRDEMPSNCRGIYDRAMSGKSRKAAMKVFCLQCVGYVRTEVTKCTSPQCPLFPYRPQFDDRLPPDVEVTADDGGVDDLDVE
jgi:hypothetical protein